MGIASSTSQLQVLPILIPLPHETLRRRALLVGIVALVILVAALDMGTSAAFIGSILFTVPVAVCGFQDSRPVLRLVAAASLGLTVIAGLWGWNREIEDPASMTVGLANRALAMTSLVTLAVFVELRIRKRLMMEAQRVRMDTMVGTAARAAVVRDAAAL